MLFHVSIAVRIPHDADHEKIKQLIAEEHERANDLQLQHKVDTSLARRRQVRKHQHLRCGRPGGTPRHLELATALPIYGGGGNCALPPSGVP
jgi:hypothetical protein